MGAMREGLFYLVVGVVVVVVMTVVSARGWNQSLLGLALLLSFLAGVLVADVVTGGRK